MLPVHTILHPTDFSESSAAAFRLACSLARGYGARLVILHASSPTSEPRDQRPAEPASWLTEQLHAVNPSGREIPFTHRLVSGDPADVILKAATEEGADLIVMGTHGRSGFGRLVLGSVAEAVTRGARCPVATVRPTACPYGEATAGSETCAPREIGIPVGPYTSPVILRGTLRWPKKARGIVVLASAGVNKRNSAGNRAVAAALADAGFAALSLDLLTEAEGKSALPFDVRLLSDRLAGVVGWLATEPDIVGLPVGLFGTGTASAAALTTAARHPDRIAAIVSCAGRPDLVWDDLPAVHAPTLLVAGGEDERSLGWNRDALWHLPGPKDMTVIAGANDPLTEPAVGQLADAAQAWFARYLCAGAAVGAGAAGH